MLLFCKPKQIKKKVKKKEEKKKKKKDIFRIRIPPFYMLFEFIMAAKTKEKLLLQTCIITEQDYYAFILLTV